MITITACVNMKKVEFLGEYLWDDQRKQTLLDTKRQELGERRQPAATDFSTDIPSRDRGDAAQIPPSLAFEQRGYCLNDRHSRNTPPHSHSHQHRDLLCCPNNHMAHVQQRKLHALQSCQYKHTQCTVSHTDVHACAASSIPLTQRCVGVACCIGVWCAVSATAFLSCVLRDHFAHQSAEASTRTSSESSEDAPLLGKKKKRSCCSCCSFGDEGDDDGSSCVIL